MVWSATWRALENKEEGGEVEEEAEEAESGERVDEVERQKREETERKRERKRGREECRAEGSRQELSGSLRCLRGTTDPRGE